MVRTVGTTGMFIDLPHHVDKKLYRDVLPFMVGSNCQLDDRQVVKIKIKVSL
jgi:hypothetical protein